MARSFFANDYRAIIFLDPTRDNEAWILYGRAGPLETEPLWEAGSTGFRTPCTTDVSLHHLENLHSHRLGSFKDFRLNLETFPRLQTLVEQLSYHERQRSISIFWKVYLTRSPSSPFPRQSKCSLPHATPRQSQKTLPYVIFGGSRPNLPYPREAPGFQSQSARERRRRPRVYSRRP